MKDKDQVYTIVLNNQKAEKKKKTTHKSLGVKMLDISQWKTELLEEENKQIPRMDCPSLLPWESFQIMGKKRKTQGDSDLRRQSK